MENLNSVGVVTISYNQVRYLPTCIRSVCDQMRQGDEYVVVDPGSSDGSREIIERAAGGSSFMNTIFQKDSGPADGLNRGFSFLNTDVAAYLNSDDFYLPGGISYARRFLDLNPQIDMFIGAIKIASSDGVINARGRVAESISLRKFLAHDLHYFQQGTFFRLEKFNEIGGFNVNNRTCWDLELVIDMALAGARIAVSSKPLAGFRIHDSSITGMGQNRIAYLADLERIRGKILASGVGPSSFFMKSVFKLEHRLNPLRFMKQLRPLWL